MHGILVRRGEIPDRSCFSGFACAVALVRTVCVSLHERNTFICGTYPHIPTSLCRRLSDCPRADPDAPAALTVTRLLPQILLPRYSHTGHRTRHTHGPWTHAHTTPDGDLESDTLTTLSMHTSEDTHTAKTTLVDYQWLRRWWRLRWWSWFPEQCLQSCCPSTVPAKR